MAFVHHQQRILRQVLEQRRRRLAGPAAGEVAAVVLDALADAGGLQHLDVELGALGQPLRLQQAAVRLQLRQPLLQLGFDRDDGLLQRRARRDVVAVGVDADLLHLGGDLAGQRVEFLQPVDLVAEQADPPGAVLELGRPDIHRLAADAEGATGEEAVVAAVLLLDQPLDQHVAVDPPAGLELHHHPRIGLDRADAVDAGDRGDDDHVVPLQQGLGGGVAHAVDLLVDLRVFFNVGVGARNIGFRLVVVVVADEVFDRVVGEEALHLSVELRRQRLVRRQDQGRALQLLDHLGHGEGLAGTGHAEQHLVPFLRPQPCNQLLDRGRLVAVGLEGGDDLQLALMRRRRTLGGEEGDRGEDVVHRLPILGLRWLGLKLSSEHCRHAATAAGIRETKSEHGLRAGGGPRRRRPPRSVRFSACCAACC